MRLKTSRVFELLNRINHTPSISNSKIDAKIKHKENVNAVLTSPDGKKTIVRSK